EAEAKRFFKTATGGKELLARAMAEHAKLRGRGRAQSQDKGLEHGKLLRDLSYSDPDMVELAVYARKGDVVTRLGRLVNQGFLETAGLDTTYLDRLAQARPIPFVRVSPSHPLLLNTSLKGGLPLITMVRQDPGTNRYLVVRARIESFL